MNALMFIKVLLSLSYLIACLPSVVRGERMEETFNVTVLPQSTSSPISIAVNPWYLVIGTPFVDYDDGSDEIFGAIQVYALSPTDDEQYVLVNEIVEEGLDGDAGFGFSVALAQKSNTLVVGAPAGSISEEIAYENGYFQILRRNEDTKDVMEDGEWEMVYEGWGKGHSIDERLGESVAIVDDGSVVAVSAPGGNEFLGRVETLMYDCLKSKWVRMGSDIIGPGESDNFGASLDIVSSTDIDNNDDQKTYYLAVGSSEYRGTKGLVRVYKYDHKKNNNEDSNDNDDYDYDWSQLGDDSIVGEATADFLGHDVSLVFRGKDLFLAVLIPSIIDKELGRVQIYKFENEQVPTWRKYQTIGVVGKDGGLIEGQIQFSPDGMRLVISSPRFQLGRGMVRVLEYKPDIGRYDLKNMMYGQNRGFFGASIGYSDSSSLAIVSPNNEEEVKLYVVSSEYEQYNYDDFHSGRAGCTDKSGPEGKDSGSEKASLPEDRKNDTFGTVFVVIASLAGISIAFLFLVKVAKRNGFRCMSLWKALPGSPSSQSLRRHTFSPVSGGRSTENVAFPVPSQPTAAIELGSMGVASPSQSVRSIHNVSSSPRSQSPSSPLSESGRYTGSPGALSSNHDSESVALSPSSSRIGTTGDDNRSECSEESHEILRQLS